MASGIWWSRICGAAVGALSCSGVVYASPPLQPSRRAPEPRSCERPLSETKTWIHLGGGVRLAEQGAVEPVFDFQGGVQTTFPLSSDGDVRLGPWGQMGSPNFDSFALGGGAVVFVGALPKPLDLFQYQGEGVLAIRAGGGWSWGQQDDGNGAPYLGGTVSYGYQAPFRLYDSFACDRSQCDGDVDTPCRACGRYMTGAKVYISYRSGIIDAAGWQATAGIEFEPVGSIRYLFGLY